MVNLALKLLNYYSINLKFLKNVAQPTSRGNRANPSRSGYLNLFALKWRIGGKIS